MSTKSFLELPRQNTLQCMKQSGKGTKLKRKEKGFHRATCRGRRGASGGDRRRGAELRRLPRSGGAARARKRGGVVRGGEYLGGGFYRVEGEVEEVAEVVETSSGGQHH
jgi:hypothetical protein